MPEIPESHRDLLDAQFATLATINPDGRPQLSEVWFLAEDGLVKFSLNNDRQKTKNLTRRPAATVLILDLANPYRYLEIRGDAEVVPDEDYSLAAKVGAKYGEDLRDRDRPGDTVCRLHRQLLLHRGHRRRRDRLQLAKRSHRARR